MKNPKILEVIVNSLEDALEAEAGGADRLEVVRDLDQGGLTPDLSLVQEIASAVQIPVRVMLRENASMNLESASELDVLCRTAERLDVIGVEGLVAGFVLRDKVDLTSLQAITNVVPRLKLTFHRAFDVLSNPLGAILDLKTVPQVDRILTVGGPGSWPSRKLRLHYWQKCASPEIVLLAGAGVLEPVISDLSRDHQISEIHIGRAARIDQAVDGPVSRLQVARLKGLSA